MATLVVQQPQTPIRHSSTPPPHAASLSLNAPRSVDPIPNKHLPYCPPGPAPQAVSHPVTPPTSPPFKGSALKPASVFHPLSSYQKISNDPPVYAIDGQTLAKAVNQISTQPMAEAHQVFPWLHGLHTENHVQLAFFTARKRASRRAPRCLRDITIVKASEDLSHSKIKGAVTPDEIFNISDDGRYDFLDCDPREGFSVRNFQIQAAKFAKISDIVIYGDKTTSPKTLRALAETISDVQTRWKREMESTGEASPTFNTFVLTVPFHELEKKHPELVAIDSRGALTDIILDFPQSERAEMCAMSKASAISGTVYQGPSPDFSTNLTNKPEGDFDIFIETSDHAQLPDKVYLDRKTRELDLCPVHVEFPSSGSISPPTWSQSEVDGLMRMCQWIYKATHEPISDFTADQDGDIPMTQLPNRYRRLLIHCADGYTESSMLVVAYYMYAEGLPVHEAWLQLHCEKQRNFFAYPSDVHLLTSIQSRILSESPRFTRTRRAGSSRRAAIPPKVDEPAWLSKMDGSLPSRILPYMYLGNLTHANNPTLLKALGIRRILSIGEPVTWSAEDSKNWDAHDLMYIDRVQDNGIDPLTQEFPRCLEFIGRGKKDGSATLVHCRVGVSRSATICIAEVMSTLGLSFPRAYCFVRARRLNVIIQPHLRFVWELMKWDEQLQMERARNASRKQEEEEEDDNEDDDGEYHPPSLGIKREMDWQTVCREIAGLNRPYSRQ